MYGNYLVNEKLPMNLELYMKYEYLLVVVKYVRNLL